MGFLFNEAFWGVLLIILGVSVVVKAIFHVNIPVFSIIIAFILIYGGIRILMGGFSFEKPQNMIIFDDSKIEITNPQDNYNIIFRRGSIDLSAVVLNKDTPKIHINTIFGGGVIRINPELPVRVTVNSAFAEAKLPDGSAVQFGNSSYQSKNFEEGQNCLQVEANVVFGGLEIVDR